MTSLPILSLLVFLSSLFSFTQCHCPHMMGIKPPGPPSGPSAPGKLPDGDDGWDFDEKSAPGILPDAHFIQSTYIYRSPNVQEKQFSTRVVQVLKQIRTRLAKSARLTLENENIECSSPTDHYRCQEFPATGTWNYFVVEDQKNGAVTYTFERKHNEKNDGTIEMALLDALSRHSPSSLVVFASSEAEKEVGYIRALTTSEMNSLNSDSEAPSFPTEKFGPNELNLLEPALLEVRTGAGLALESESLKKIDNTEQFDKLLDENEHVFILFWNSNRMVSLHTFNLWSRTAEKLKNDGMKESIQLAHVACQDNADFCSGLQSDDFHTVVAFRKGQNIGKTKEIGDEKYYEKWIELMLSPSIQKIDNPENLAEFKRGIFAGKRRPSVTIGVFPSEQDTAFRHFKIAAEKLNGKFYLAYFISEQTVSSVTTYQHAEKQKRTDYTGKYDPASLMEFIAKSSIPTVMDITSGFTTNLLLRQKRSILILIGDQECEPYAKLSARKDARKAFIFTKISLSSADDSNVKDTLEALGIDEKSKEKTVIVVLNKDRVHLIPASKPKCPDHLHKLLQITATSEADKVLSTKSPHPLRHLQLRRVNEIFGSEKSIVLPDHTLFLDTDPFARHPPIPEGGTGGCPFMQGGGAGSSKPFDNSHGAEL